MRERCPAALAVGRARLPDHRLVFRQWADVEPSVGSVAAGGLWRITEDCVAALDDYEEVGAGLYRRFPLTVEVEGAGRAEALVYRMAAKVYAPPEPDYLAAVLRGCRDFGLDEAPVLVAADVARTFR